MGPTAKAGLLFGMVALIVAGQLVERDFAKRRAETKARRAAASTYADLLTPLADAPLPRSAPTAPPAGVANEPAETTYVVQPGDTLARIARKLLGSEGAWRSIYERNRAAIPNPAQLQVGTALRIPRAARAERR